MRLSFFLSPLLINGFRRAAGVCLFAALAFPAAGFIPGPEVALTGPLDLDRILAAVPEWARAARAYEPDFQAIDSLHTFDKSVRIRVFVGTWDADETGPVAAFIKSLEMADNSSIVVDWIGVSRDLKEPAALLRDNRVTRIPTFIIWTEGEEKGRIVGKPRETMETDLAALFVGLPLSDADLSYFRRTPHSHLPIDCTRCHAPARPGGVRRASFFF